VEHILLIGCTALQVILLLLLLLLLLHLCRRLVSSSRLQQLTTSCGTLYLMLVECTVSLKTISNSSQHMH
jgi:hypothetical protein